MSRIPTISQMMNRDLNKQLNAIRARMNRDVRETVMEFSKQKSESDRIGKSVEEIY